MPCRYECAKLLHKAGADVEAANARGGTAMVVACVMGEADTVRLLLSMGANADALTVAIDDTEQLFQCRPLVTACRYDRPKCVSLLLAAGVSIEAMTVAMTELAEFPNFVECARLVRKAIEKHERRAASGGGVGAGGRRAGSGAALRRQPKRPQRREQRRRRRRTRRWKRYWPRPPSQLQGAKE